MIRPPLAWRRLPTAAAAATLARPQTPAWPPARSAADAVVEFYAARRMSLDGQQTYEQVMTSLSLRMQFMADGTDTPDSLDLLASLGWQIGLAAEIALQLDPLSPLQRRLHGALRTVHAMCLQGYAWRSQHGPALDAAAAAAGALIQAHPPLAMRLMPGAAELAESIRARAVRPDAVAGAEIYSTSTSTSSDR